MTTQRFYYKLFNVMNADEVDRLIEKGSVEAWEYVLAHGVIRTTSKKRALFHLEKKYGEDKVFYIVRFNALRSGQVTELP